ncbi:MAG: DegV family protein [Lachnospiraceae bacterium]|nr:DegV family protein [Lachnospiraceae bacterium]
MDYVIVMDSCGERTEEMKADEHIISAPLTMQVDEYSIADDDSFDQADFLAKIAASPNSPKSACPSPDYYKKSFEKADSHAYAVTLSAELSGSCNSAVLARELLEEEGSSLRVHVFNSRSASIGETLITAKIQECEDAGMPFDELVECVESYIEGQNTYFVLENLETLRKNGRLSNIKAFFASALRIKPVMGATPEGTIIQLDQARGINKALVKMVDYIVEQVENPAEKILALSHCNCPERGRMVLEAIQKRIPVKDVIFLDTAGISTMYANDGGVIVVI